MQVLVFRVGKEAYGFRLSDVSEAVAGMSVLQIPRVPLPFLGIFQLRGRVIALLDLIQCFWADVAALQRESEVLVLAGAAQSLAVRVPGLVESAQIESEALEAAAAEGIGAVLDGIVCENQQIYHVLSATKLLNHARNILAESEKATRVDGGLRL